MKKKILYMLMVGLVSMAQNSFSQSFLRVIPSTNAVKPKGGGTSTGNPSLNTILTKYGTKKYRQTYPGFKTPGLDKLYTLTATGNIDSLKKELDNSGLFDTVIVKGGSPAVPLCSSPLPYNDPFTLSPARYQVELIEAPCAWTITEGDPKVVVAVIDTEFDTFHEDLEGKFVRVYDDDPGAPILVGHGTLISSMAAAHVNNGKGLAGAGNKISLAGYKVDAESINASLENCIVQAYNDGCRIINVSWTGVGSLDISAIEEMTQNGTVLVVAAGNNPASLSHSGYAHIPGVVLVSSVNYENKIGPTNHARNIYIDVCAPGTDVLVAQNDPFNDYTLTSGTSVAAPLVAGTVGLMLSINPCLSAAEVETILKNTCDPIADAATYPGLYGSGRINAYEAVLEARDFNSTTSITTNTTWATDRTHAGRVVVKTGNTLTITAQIRMLCGGIVVEKGARLIVDGGHITSYNANTKWDGIDLWGNRDLGAFPANQGMVELKNGAVIENARVGISNYVWDNGAQGGGIIKATNATFLNCRRAVELNDYANYSYWVGPGNSNCSFEHCTFKIDDTRILNENPTSFPYLFSSWNVLGGVKIVNSTFELNVATSQMAYPDRGFAIHLASSGALIRDNTFKGFRYGVNTTSYSGTPTRHVKVFRNEFDYISQSIVVAGDAFADVRENDIANMLPIYSTYTGIYAMGIFLEGSRGSYIGCGNSVTGVTDVGPGRTAQKCGLAVVATGEFSNTVMDNTFISLAKGALVQWDNPQLSIACNTLGYNTTALEVGLGSPAGSGHRMKDQGTGCGDFQVRADNIFLDNNTPDLVAHDNTVPWAYYAANRTDEVPVLTGSTVGLTECDITDPSEQCNKPLNCVYSLSDLYDAGHLSDFTTRYSSLANSGLRYAAEGRLLYGQIVRAYNDLGNSSGLQSFLEGQNDEESRRLLVPLYIERGLYTKATNTINSLSLSQAARWEYTSYYNLLKTLRQQGRRIDQLTAAEKSLVEGIAAGEGELYPQAKALLEAVYGYNWEHLLRDGTPPTARPAAEASLQAKATVAMLGDARPNPAQATVHIEATVTKNDMRYGPVLVIRNSMGCEVYRRGLQAGANSLDIDLRAQPRGLYFYSLEGINGTPIAKKLSLQ